MPFPTTLFELALVLNSIHPENILFSMLMSNIPDDRKMAYEAIAKIRAPPMPPIFPTPAKYPNKRIRPFHTPEINFKAEKISDLIDWDGPLTEPPLTIGIPLDELELQAELGDFLVFPDIPCHAQQIENTVPKVTRASGRWKSFETRHQTILCQLEHLKNRSSLPEEE